MNLKTASKICNCFLRLDILNTLIMRLKIGVKSFHVKLIEHSFKEVLIFKRHGTDSEGNDL